MVNLSPKYWKLSVIFMLLFATACSTPNTQPLIDATLQWKKIEDEELQRHRDMLSVAKFHTDAVKNAEAKAKYADALNKHSKTADQFAQAIINWAQRVGKFDQKYADATLDKMIETYIKVKGLVK